MSEQSSSRQPVEARPPVKKGDSQFRVVTDDDAVVFPDEAEASDDSPTIISHAKESNSNHGQEMLLGSLRGRKLAHFELIEPIGVGGMAAVLRARDTQLDRFVALKILPPEMAADPENIKRFHQEARAAAKLDHPNIARVFFCGEDKRLNFIAFEFVEGENLRTLLEKRGQLPVAEAIRYILQIATGLDHAASRGVVHRDIKPSNIIISPNGTAKLVDMGLARSQEPHNNQALTQSGVTLGTFDYLSPEQALEPREADARSDIYSLGCTLYHMLTGQPPVPEGTAAKKLHHHQHIAPIDPRQLNSSIPDEVAAILMRMMAKDPKDRYQRPVHLIQHLLQVAQKVGAGADIPEGGLFLDAPLPGAPRLRPLLTISFGTLGLAVLLLLLSLSPPTPREIPQANNKVAPTSPGPGKKDAPPVAVDVVPPVDHNAGAITSTRELVQSLTDNQNPVGTLLLTGQVSLPSQGLISRGDSTRKLVVKGSSTDDSRLLFSYQTPVQLPADGKFAGLTLEGGEVVFEDLSIEVEGTESPSIPVSALAVRNNTTVKFVRCKFVQRDMPFRAFIIEKKRLVPLASVLVDNTAGNSSEKPVVTFQECYFQRGQAAVAVQGPADVKAENCAFGPHGALFHLRGDMPNFATTVKLDHCSALLIQGPAFRLDDAASCVLQVEYSIFSCPGYLPGEERDDIQLIRQIDSREPLVRYRGRRNCYHNFEAFWSLVNGASVKGTLREFTEAVALLNGQDSLSTVATTSPWRQADILQKLSNPSDAFPINPSLREVRKFDGTGSLGMTRCLRKSMPVLTPLLSERPIIVDNKLPLKANEKIIDPAADESTRGINQTVFQSLAKALPFALPNDVLLLKQAPGGREIPLKMLDLNDPKCNLIIRPYKDHHPVLVLDSRDRQKDAALFRLYDGRVQFENLEFHLEPEQQDYKAQAVVALGGTGSCSFKNCVITMRNSDNRGPETRVPLSVITFLDPDDVMKMPQAIMPRFLAQIQLNGCLVRGEGELVTVRSSRPFELKVDKSLLALSGSFLLVKGDKEVAMEPAAQIRLTQTTAFTSEPFVVLRGKGAKSLALTRFELVRECQFVFVPDKSMTERPFILLENVEAGEDSLKILFAWKGEKNAFVNMTKMLESYRPEDSTFANVTWETDAWQKNEAESPFLNAAFVLQSLTLRPFSQMSLEHFKPKAAFRETLTSFGVLLDPELLPPFTSSRRLDTEPLAPGP